jgi:hypothetical protein
MKMKLLNKLFILLISLIILIPSSFADGVNTGEPTIVVDSLTVPDVLPDRFYVSQNIVRQINFSIKSDYVSLVPYKNPIVKYTLSVYPESEVTKGTYFKLSTNQEEFLSEINSTVGVEVIAKAFTENLVKVKVTAELYDEYNNLIATGYKSITLITNNSNNDYTYTPHRDEPSFKGISYSRDVSYLINKADNDLIKIKSYSDFNYVYDIKCNADNQGLITRTLYTGDNIFDLNISIDSSKNLSKGTYQIKCYAYNQDNQFDLKVIRLNYLDESIIQVIDTNTMDSNISVEPAPTSSFKDKLLRFRNAVKDWTLSALKKIRSVFE